MIITKFVTFLASTTNLNAASFSRSCSSSFSIFCFNPCTTCATSALQRYNETLLVQLTDLYHTHIQGHLHSTSFFVSSTNYGSPLTFSSATCSCHQLPFTWLHKFCWRCYLASAAVFFLLLLYSTSFLLLCHVTVNHALTRVQSYYLYCWAVSKYSCSLAFFEVLLH